jgi:hypothetical protein
VEVANQSSTAFPVTAAVHFCAVCGKRFSIANSLRFVLKLVIIVGVKANAIVFVHNAVGNTCGFILV